MVVSATHIATKTAVAIKLMTKLFKEKYNAKKTVGEVEILRKLSALKGNCFTTHIYDVITPEFDVDSADPIDYLFIVMEKEETDLCKVLDQYELI